MAGGKETPRQKLIGLMYLVLLALLALQVSSAILQKFQFLNSTLEVATKNAGEGNDTKIKAIAKAVEKAPNYKNVLTEAEQVRAKSAEMQTYIQSLKDEILKRTGGLDEAGNFAGAKDEDIVANFMVGVEGTKKGKAYEMEKKLNAYVTEMNAKYGTNFPLLALSGEKDPITAKDKEQRKKDFAELNFANTPMVAGMAVLSDKQSKIANMESVVLGELATKVGAKEIKFDVIQAAYNAESKVVAAGTKYVARMFITASSSSIKPKMTFKGSAIKVENGQGLIEFRAAAGAYDKEGNSKQTWEGKISMPKPTGEGDTTFTVKGEYIVAKPVISVKSASVQALYLNCGNDLDIQVPALGATYNPSITANGATVIRSASKGQVIVIPSSSNKVKINVSNDGTAIGFVEFDVRPVPKPTIMAKVNGNPVDLRRGVAAPGPAQLQVSAVAEPAFASALPKEARYRVVEGEALLARGKREIAKVAINSDFININNLRGQAVAGDRIIIEVTRMQRANYRNELETVTLSKNNSIITIPIN